MKKLFWSLTVLVFCACGEKKKSGTAGKGESLEKRVDAFLDVNQQLDFEGIMDYTYPKVFDLAPRSQMVKLLKESFNNEEMKISLDSLKVIKIHPVFEMDGGSYAKIDYSMVMFMDPKDDDSDKDRTAISDSSDADDVVSGIDASPKSTLMQTMMEEQFGKGNVDIHPSTGVIKIRQKSEMVAIKDKYSKDWTFINMNREQQVMLDKLLPKDVQAKIDSY